MGMHGWGGVGWVVHVGWMGHLGDVKIHDKH